MELRNLDSITAVVKTFAGKATRGSEEEVLSARALADLDYLTTLARTNFAACQDPRTAGIALLPRMPMITGGGQLMESVTKWLYSAAKEKCACTSPDHISCDYALAVGDCGTDVCSLKDECPFKHHTRTFE